MLKTTTISCDLDFESDGKRIGKLKLIHSDNENSFGSIPVPIAVTKNGNGPTFFLSGGCHGDEYEGQVIARRLIHEINPADIRGRLIIMPALNYPAALSNQRISPIDQVNLNRAFPGMADGGPTSAIAHFVTTQLLPMCDAGMDLHAGGQDAYYVPCSYLCTCEDPDIMQKSIALSEAFNAPFVFMVDGRGASTGFDPVAQKNGVPFISAELAGGAGVDMDATEIGINGIKNILQYLGIQDSGPHCQSNSIYLNAVDGSFHVEAPYSGIFEPLCKLGDKIQKGQLAGRLYSMEEIERPPLELTFEGSGTIIVTRREARVKRGSYVYQVASEIPQGQHKSFIK